MKLLTILYLTLFSFSYNDSYKVENYSCENNEIQIQYEQNWYLFTLFNVFIEEGEDVCAYVQGEVRFEFEPLRKIDTPLQGYLFVNDELLQSTLIKAGVAQEKIANPAYKYPVHTREEETMATPSSTQKSEHAGYIRNVALAFIVVWVLICLYLLVRRRSKHIQKDIKSDENVV